jgi:Glycosyltransferases involved in cell wall biogenesis
MDNICSTHSAALSVIIPIYNEEASLRAVLDELVAELESFAARAAFAELSKFAGIETSAERGCAFEIIAVDDGSSDASPAILRGFAQAHRGAARVFALDRNCGQSAAFWAGIQQARGAVIVLMDADGQNTPTDIPRLVSELASSGADIVCGFRAHRRDTFSKRLASRAANSFRRAILRDGVIDTGCSLKAFKAPVLKRLQCWDGMHRFLPVLALAQGAKLAQIPVGHRARFAGKSKYTNFGRLKRTVADLLGVRWLASRTRQFEVEEMENEF